MPVLGSTGFNKTIFTILLVSTLLAIGMSFYKFYITKDYPFIVEASCDPLFEECSERDCEELDECPETGVFYKSYEISAADFDQCIDGTCEYECENGMIQCTEISDEK